MFGKSKGAHLLFVCLMVGILALGASAEAGEVAKIKFLTFSSPAEMLREVGSIFESQNPDIKISIEVMPSTAIPTFMTAAFMAGEAPMDIIYPRLFNGMEWARRGFILNLDKYVEEIDTDDYFPGMFETGKYEGSVYAIPMRVAAFCLIYNAGLLEAVGLDPNRPPQNWEEYVSSGKKITDLGKGQYGFGMVAGEMLDTIRQLSTFILSNGGRFLNDDLTKVTVNEKQSIEAVQFWVDLHLKYHITNPSPLEWRCEDAFRLLAGEGVAMIIDGPWTIDTVRRMAGKKAAELMPKIRVGLIPEGPAGIRATLGWVRSVMIPAKTIYPEQSWRFVKFLTSSEIIAKYCRALPPLKSSSGAERYHTPQMEAFTEMLMRHKIVSEPLAVPWTEIIKVIHDEVQGVILEKKNVQEAMDDATKNANKILEERK